MLGSRLIERSTKMQQGFTLIEVIVTLVVAAVITSIGFANYSNFVARAQVSSEVDTLAAYFNFARIQALSLNQDVTVVTDSGANSWAGSRTVLAGGQAIRIINGGAEGVTVTSTALAHPSVTFTGRGLLSAAEPAQFTVCSTNTSIDGQILTINQVGRVSTQAASCGNGG